MTRIYSDKERVEIATKEYEKWVKKAKFRLNNTYLIGYVSQVNNKPTGEQSFVITDKYVSPTASLEERSKIEEMTILYRGSTAHFIDNVLNPSDKYYYDVRNDC